jgi:hypothetical protein
MVAVALPAVVLFVIAVSQRDHDPAGVPPPWRAVTLVTSILLAPVALFLFLVWVGADLEHLLYDAAVLLATAAIAMVGGRLAGAAYAFFLAGLALLFAWILLWLKVFSHPSLDTVRLVVLAGGVVLLAAAATMFLRRQRGDIEIATAGGVGVVGAGILGVYASTFGLLVSAGAPERTSGPHVFGIDSAHLAGGQTTGWDVYLLVVSLGLIWLAARSRARGPGYVGAIGTLFFMTSITSQLARLASGHGPSRSLAGWPLALAVLGVIGIAIPELVRRRSR